MSNWLQEHPAYTIIGHTIVVATATWLVSSFVIDENKVNLYRAQTENANAISEQYKAKASVLELELSRLRVENERYLSWLTQEPKTIPALENKIKALEAKLASSKPIVDSGSPLPKPTKLPYEFTSPFSKGETFVDPKTKASIGISNIGANYTATGVLYLPGEKNIELKEVKPGSTWTFEQNGVSYKMTLEGVNWINNSLKASVTELDSPKNPNNKIQVTPKSGAPD